MKCKARIIIEIKKKNDKNRTSYEKIKPILNYEHYLESPNHPIFSKYPNHIECDGDIQVTLENSIGGCGDSECCGSYADFTINYKCNKCGGIVYRKDLPHYLEELQQFTQTQLDNLND